MATMISTLLGGIGLFLLGMVLLTDGLKAFAGDSLRRLLVRCTGTPLKAFASGALVTAVIQSSSATTVTLIGFVSAGLLTFPHAVGVVFGASFGTTSNGWLISSLGLKVRLGAYALPLVGAGAFLRVLGRRRWKSLGLALAGFGLIFVGIATLQEGMQGAAASFDLAALPAGGFRGRLAALGIGFLLTVLMQSSSAAVATVLTALHMGAVRFEQAAVLAIGAAVGTTVKGALVAIGATVSAKRTALAHILFNTATGGIALLLLPGFLRALDWAQRRFGLDAGAQSLALFHTLFIAVGVLVFLPFTRRFARLIERLLPDRELRPTRHLDKSLLSVPAVALEAARRALCETARETVVLLQTLLGGAKEGLDEARRARFAEVIDEIRDFLAQIPALISDEALSELHLAQIHGVDHLLRLQSRLEPSPGVRLMFLNPHLAPAVQVAQDVLATAAAALASGPEGHCADRLDRLRSLAVNLAELRRSERVALLRKTAGGDWIDSEALDALDAGRWMDGVGYHVWRLCHYLASPDAPGAFPADAQELHPED